MTRVRLYDMGTHHIETVYEAESTEEAEAWMLRRVAQDKATDFIYFVDDEEEP